MTYSMTLDEETQAHPLDLIEQIVAANDWPFDRRCDDEMAVEVPGKWCDYSLYFAWREDVGALHFTVSFDMKVQPAKRAAIYELLALVNERLWLGHFGLWADEGIPLFRHSVLLRGQENLNVAQVEDLIDVAMEECDRFYPAFQFVIWGGKSVADAIAAAMIETVGQA